MNWLIDITKLKTDHKIFNKKTSNVLKSIIMYVNSNNDIINIVKNKRKLINNNIVTKDELIDLLIENKKNNNINYNSYKIMKFNIDLNVDQLESFIKDDTETHNEYFTDCYNNISDIIFEESMFTNFNYLFIILKEKVQTNPNSKTKRVNCFVKRANKKTRKYLNINKE